MLSFDYIVRKANGGDSLNIAKTIAYSFEKDFSGLVKDMECMVKVFANSIITERFFVAEQNGEIIGVIACTDCCGRAVNINKNDFKKHLGFIRGLIGYSVFYSELMRPLTYSATTGNIEFVGVLQSARGRGVAKKMLKEIIENNPVYSEFVLYVTDTNRSAQKCYADFGFVEFDRVPVSYAKQKGFNSKIYMKYKRLV